MKATLRVSVLAEVRARHNRNGAIHLALLNVQLHP
jgi:hypothetical protein